MIRIMRIMFPIFFRKEKFFNKLLVTECLDDENIECLMISISISALKSDDKRLMKISRIFW